MHDAYSSYGKYCDKDGPSWKNGTNLGKMGPSGQTLKTIGSVLVSLYMRKSNNQVSFSSHVRSWKIV